ncbi:MAG: trehalose-phosphatase [Actinomycetota bacterium]
MTTSELPLAAPASLAAELGPADQRLLVLDFDGVLSPIVAHYDQAVPVEGAVEALAALAEVTLVAVVSGRSVADLERRLGTLPIVLAGGHGAQLRLSDGRPDHLVDPATVAATLDATEQRVATLVDEVSGWLIERKQTSLAIHHRLADPSTVDALLPRVRALFEQAATEPPGFELLEGKAVIELRPAGVDKGRAVDRLAEHAPTLQPLVLGDDVTDEDAFRAATAHGGDAVLVAEEPRPTAANHRLADPTAVVAFLESLLEPES